MTSDDSYRGLSACTSKERNQTTKGKGTGFESVAPVGRDYLLKCYAPHFPLHRFIYWLSSIRHASNLSTALAITNFVFFLAKSVVKFLCFDLFIQAASVIEVENLGRWRQFIQTCPPHRIGVVLKSTEPMVIFTEFSSAKLLKAMVLGKTVVPYYKGWICLS